MLVGGAGSLCSWCFMHVTTHVVTLECLHNMIWAILCQTLFVPKVYDNTLGSIIVASSDSIIPS